MFLCDVVLAHALVHVAQPVPPVVVPVVSGDGAAVRLHGLVEFLVGDVLVALQGEGVGEFGVELRGAREALDRVVVLALQGGGVTQGAPGLR